MGMGKAIKKVKGLGIKTARMKKADLIREIQRAEGNFDWFGMATDNRNQWEFYFKEDSLPSPKSRRNR